VKPAAAAIAGGGSAAAMFALSAADASEWLTVIERIVQSPAGVLVFALLVLVGLSYLLVRQWKGGEDCAARQRQLESVVQGMYALLATDDRYQGLPPYADFAAGNFSIAEIHRSRSAPAFTRSN
jgi:hypothetical protein